MRDNLLVMRCFLFLRRSEYVVFFRESLLTDTEYENVCGLGRVRASSFQMFKKAKGQILVYGQRILAVYWHTTALCDAWRGNREFILL